MHTETSFKDHYLLCHSFHQFHADELSFSDITNCFSFCFFDSFDISFDPFVLTRKNTITLEHIPSPLSLSSSILFALKSMAMILSYLFLSITLKTLFVLYFPFLEEITHLLSEFSSAVLYFRHHEHVMIFLLICIGFGGFASHLQVMNGCDEITMSYNHYLFFQIAHMLLNLMIYFIFSFLFL